MMNLRQLSCVCLIAASFVGCSSHSVAGRPGAEEAARNMEESRQEYADCIAQRSPGEPVCASLKELADQDRDEYEQDVR